MNFYNGLSLLKAQVADLFVETRLIGLHISIAGSAVECGSQEGSGIIGLDIINGLNIYIAVSVVRPREERIRRQALLRFCGSSGESGWFRRHIKWTTKVGVSESEYNAHVFQQYTVEGRTSCGPEHWQMSNLSDSFEIRTNFPMGNNPDFT